jgi:long-chain acyl-CoA synthetase
MFTNAELLPTLIKVLGECPKLNAIIYDGEPKGDILAQLQAVREGVKLYTIQELEALGRAQSEIKVVPPKRSDTCCVMYTSVRGPCARTPSRSAH